MRRGTAAQRGYGSRWAKARKGYLVRHPLCVDCGALATDVDHDTPVTGPADPNFWRVANWRARCHACHSRKTARENGGFGNKMRGGGAGQISATP